jgi:type IV secretory pathway TraG/TraD family ATPase VirD4
VRRSFRGASRLATKTYGHGGALLLPEEVRQLGAEEALFLTEGVAMRGRKVRYYQAAAFTDGAPAAEVPELRIESKLAPRFTA